MKEIWKDIEGYEGYYMVSNLGRVKSLKYGKILKANATNRLYDQVCLCVDYRKYKNIHRLVAETFIPNPDNKEQVNHKDGDKQNNCLSNLEWATRSENAIHAHRNGLIKRHPKYRYISSDIVKKVRADLGEGIKGVDIARKYAICNMTVSRIKNNKGCFAEL